MSVITLENVLSSACLNSSKCENVNLFFLFECYEDAIATYEEYCIMQYAKVIQEATGLYQKVQTESIVEAAKKFWEKVKAFFVNLWKKIKSLFVKSETTAQKSRLEKCVAAAVSKGVDIDKEENWIHAPSVLDLITTGGQAGKYTDGRPNDAPDMETSIKQVGESLATYADKLFLAFPTIFQNFDESKVEEAIETLINIKDKMGGKLVSGIREKMKKQFDESADKDAKSYIYHPNRFISIFVLGMDHLEKIADDIMAKANEKTVENAKRSLESLPKAVKSHERYPEAEKAVISAVAEFMKSIVDFAKFVQNVKNACLAGIDEFCKKYE